MRLTKLALVERAKVKLADALKVQARILNRATEKRAEPFDRIVTEWGPERDSVSRPRSATSAAGHTVLQVT